METQCWICPICFDDHAQGKQCEPITHEQYNEICRQSNFNYQEFKRVEKDLTAAQAEIAELKELIKREVVPDIKDAEIARLQSALDVAVEVLGATWPNVFQEIYEHHQAAIDKIKQIRGEK